MQQFRVLSDGKIDVLVLLKRTSSFLSLISFTHICFFIKVDLYFQQFNDLNDSFQQKLWAMFLLSLLLPSNREIVPNDNILNTFRLNKILQCSLTVLRDKATLTPYSVAYDSEEETMTLEGNHDSLNKALSSKVRFFWLQLLVLICFNE